MLSSSVRTFTEPADYAAAIRQGTHQLTITQSGIFAAKLHRIDFHCLWMQRFSENLARTSNVDGWGGRAIIAFGTQPGPRLVRNGVELRPNSISQLSPGQNYYQHSSGPSSYGTMSLPLEEFASLLNYVEIICREGRELVDGPGRPADLDVGFGGSVEAEVDAEIVLGEVAAAGADLIDLNEGFGFGCGLGGDGDPRADA